MDKKFSAVVAGAGISGVRSALDLAELGYKVLLIDRKENAGGILSKLDHQFPNDHCGMCRTLPMIDRNKGAQFCLRKGVFHRNITFMPASKIDDVSGTPGNLSVSITKSPTGVDPDKCTGCMICESVCPVEVNEGFNENLSLRKAVYLPVPHNVPNKRVIDFEACTKCGECVSACPTDAINLSMEPEIIELSGVGSVILATGTELYDPEPTDLYAMDHLKNVVTASSFERIMSSSGPYKGKIIRPSDGKEIKKVAFIQCVGSRNIMIGADYCSSVCCMFALKEASLLSDKVENAESAIFCMDLRTFTRDAERYKEIVQKKGTRIIRCRIHSVEESEGDDLHISYVDSEGKQRFESFDLVVLSTGKTPNQKYPEFFENEGVFPINETPDFKEISESMINASVASSKAIKIAKEFAFETKEEVVEKIILDKSDKKVKTQVILCACGNQIKEDANFPLLLEKLEKHFPDAGISQLEHACSKKGWEDLRNIIVENKANRIIIGACNPQIFRSKLTFKSIPAEIFDIKEHLNENRSPDDVTGAIFSEIASGIQRLKKYSIPNERKIPVNKRALVIGGGISGITSANYLTSWGVPVTLVEKSDKLGGNLPLISDPEVKAKIKTLIEKVSADSNIEILFNSEVLENRGTPGKFTAKIASGDDVKTVKNGSVIVATGGSKTDFTPGENAITTFDLSFDLAEGKRIEAKSVVMIQCHESREEPFNYCSRICCAKALENAIKLKEVNPETKVTVLYRDIMAYGDIEKKYTEARRKGVSFKRYEKGEKPEIVKTDSGYKVSLHDFVLNEKAEINCDLLVYSTRVAPSVDGLDKVLKLKTSPEGFIKETDTKFRPVDTGKEGIFVCGLRRNPVNAFEAEKEGISAAQRALRILNSEILTSSGYIAQVREAICSRCNACVAACPYEARYVSVEDRKVKVDQISCQGCGTCASVCPNNATIIEGLEEKGVLDSIESALL